MRANLKETRVHSIKCDYGIKDYFKYYKNNGGKLDHKTFRNVLYTFNRGLYEIICTTNYEYKLPKKLGSIFVVESETFVDSDNSVLKTNRAIDYKTTLDVWEKNPELREQKFVVRFEDPYVFKIKYSKKNAIYKNKSLYLCGINRQLKQFLKNIVKTNPKYRAQNERKLYLLKSNNR